MPTRWAGPTATCRWRGGYTGLHPPTPADTGFELQAIANCVIGGGEGAVLAAAITSEVEKTTH